MHHGKRIATPVYALARNDTGIDGFCTKPLAECYENHVIARPLGRGNPFS